MELSDAIDHFRAELERVKCAITALEAVLDKKPLPEPPTKSNRGRKSMGEAERLVVGARMKKYWAARRIERARQPATDGDAGHVH
jgi:hypothetical protein